MANHVYDDIMNGNKDTNICFSDLRYVLESNGFKLRIRGDHYIYYRADIAELVNIQPNGKMAKPYQVKQIRRLFNLYGL